MTLLQAVLVLRGEILANRIDVGYIVDIGIG